MATHSSILAWRTPWTEELGGKSPWGCKELDMTEQLNNNNTLELRQYVKCDKSQQSAEDEFQNLDWHLEIPASRDVLYGEKKKTPGVEILEKPIGGFWGTEITFVWNRDSWKGMHGFDTCCCC